jgi:hypothetical protein
MRQYHYITYDDCLNICKAIGKGDTNKSMIVISAPTGANLEVREEEKGDCILKMESTNGNIKVYTCKLNEGVKTV